MTEAAIEKGEAEKRRRLALEKQIAEKEAEHKKILDDLRRETILEQILPTIELRAAQGRSHAVVMDLKREDCIDGILLGGVARDVYSYCIVSGLKTEIERWEDGVGVSGGYQIVIKW